ncbi:MAG: toll/interleukin-1 receptor domain-containing protein [Candidatus Korobacteraceae bacterium]
MQVFLSYAHPDEALAEALAADLKKRGLSVWSHDAELLPGDNVWLRNGEALENSEAMVVLVSPESMRSEWVRREIEYALGDQKYEGKLFPVQVKPTPSMPWILREFKIFDARQGFTKIGEAIAGALKQVA